MEIVLYFKLDVVNLMCIFLKIKQFYLFPWYFRIGCVNIIFYNSGTFMNINRKKEKNHSTNLILVTV